MRTNVGRGLVVSAAAGLLLACSGGSDGSNGASDSTDAGGVESSTAPDGSPESGSATAPPTTTGGLLDGPQMVVPPLLDEAKVGTAVDQLDDVVAEAMDQTGVPGVAVGVVYQDEVLFAEGFGVRRADGNEPVDADTVFQVASVSKPVASTIVAGVVGQGAANWTDPAVGWFPDLALADPYVTANATLADLLSHRTGLPTIAGNLLEDLGWDQQYIVGVLDQQPLDAFRSTYHYSDYGYTLGGLAAAAAMDMSWEDLADRVLFEPLGMASSSYRHDDYLARENMAHIHTRVGPAEDKLWEPRFDRDPDAQAPAGGLSSSVNDMIKLMRLQLGAGTIDGTQVVDPAALQVTHIPHSDLSQPTAPGERTEFYGLGWNVTYDDHGRVRLDHSGAFLSGAATTITLIPGEQLGIITLTNGQPHGIPEAINDGFIDIAQNGRPTVDWLDFFAAAMEGLYTEGVDTSWSSPPAQPAPAADLNDYLGTYESAHYGPLTVTSDGGALSMSMGPPDRPTRFILTHFDGDVFTFDTIGENSTGTSGATFTRPPGGGPAASVTLEAYDTTGIGTFTRQ